MKITKMKNNLQKYRKWRGLTQQELANKAKISMRLICQIENDYKLPKYQIRKKLCNIFGINQNQLFETENDL